MPTETTNYGLQKPLVNNATDQDLWGGYLNGDLDELDGLILTAMNFNPVAETATFSITAPTPGSAVTGNSKTLFRCDATSAAMAGNLPTAETAGFGYTVAFKKTDASAHAVTLTASGSDKIDGAATFVLSTQYNWAILVSDGVSNWDILSDTPPVPITPTFPVIRTQRFSSSGTYTPDPHLISGIAEGVGGGGGGGGATGGTNGGGGGGAGLTSRISFLASDIGTSQVVTIGSDGAAGSSSGTNGGDGTATSLGTLLTCDPGIGGTGVTLNAQSGVGGSGGLTGTGLLVQGATGQSGFAGPGAAPLGGTGASSFFGGGGPGGAPGPASSSVAGTAAVAWGSGGGGGACGSGASGVAGGAGQTGYLIITEYCSQ